MIANKTPRFFFCQEKNNNKHFYILLAMTVLLNAFLFSDAMAAPEPDKNYLRLQKNTPSDSDDLEIISIGVLALQGNKYGHGDLSNLKSVENGDAVTLDLGAGFAFNWNVSLFIGVGISLGYNTDDDDTVAAYYPEAGIVWDVTDKFGLTASARRYYHLYEDDEDLVIFGLVFRN